MTPRRPYEGVDAFEEELAAYCGAPFAVAVDSCTTALFLSLEWEYRRRTEQQGLPILHIPRRTYIGVQQAAMNSCWHIAFTDDSWDDAYALLPTRVIDSARHISRGMYFDGTLTCLSFHAAKQLPIGRGGAILTDNQDFVNWARRARQDGRTPGDDSVSPLFPAWHMYMTPPDAARGLWLLSRLPDSPPPLPEEVYPDLSVLCEPTAYEVGYGY